MTETTDETGAQPENYQVEAVAIGRILAAAREKQELSIADVARQLRLGAKQIEALEEDDYVSLPGSTFVRGFIRNYARLLQVDPEPLLQSYQQRAPSEALAMSAPPRGGEFSVYPSKRWMWYAGAVAAMVIAAPLLVYFALGGSDDAPAVGAAKAVKPALRQSTVQLPSAVPLQQPASPQITLPAVPQQEAPVAVQQPAAATSMPVQPVRAESVPASGSGRIVFKFDRESWTQVRDRDGKKIFSQLNLAGTEQVVQGEPPFTLVVGNAAHVHATYNGVQVDLTPYVNVDVARLTLE
jgi:cytoskeleton protein RodZ